MWTGGDTVSAQRGWRHMPSLAESAHWQRPSWQWNPGLDVSCIYGVGRDSILRTVLVWEIQNQGRGWMGPQLC